MAFFGGRFGDFGKKKRERFTLKGVITRYENGIQTVRTEAETQSEFKYIQCMGMSLIKCPVCKEHPYAAFRMTFSRPCEHVHIGTSVVMEYHVNRDVQGNIQQGYWTGKAVV